MTSHKLRTIVVGIIIVLMVVVSLYYGLSDKPDRGGHITCYSRDGDVIYSEDVEYVSAIDGVWYVSGGVKITGDCMFIPDEK